jgi:hypothetical protein
VRQPSSGRTLAPLLAFAVLLTLVPGVVAVSRTSTFEASVDVRPRPAPPLGLPREPNALLLKLIRSGRVENRLMAEAGFLLDSEAAAEAARVEAVGDDLQVTATASSPDRARRLVHALADLAEDGSEREIQERARALLDGLEGEPPARGLSVAERRSLERHRALLASVSEESDGWFDVGEPWTTTSPSSLDRALDRLPGPFSPAAHPLLAAACGFVVAAIVCGVALGGRIPSRSRARD